VLAFNRDAPDPARGGTRRPTAGVVAMGVRGRRCQPAGAWIARTKRAALSSGVFSLSLPGYAAAASRALPGCDGRGRGRGFKRQRKPDPGCCSQAASHRIETDGGEARRRGGGRGWGACRVTVCGLPSLLAQRWRGVLVCGWLGWRGHPMLVNG
jgi:hypothetical protein